MNYADLTERQRQVVDSTAIARIVLTLGGPGSGKTTTALWAAKTHLESVAPTPWARVLFLTFSRTAVTQIARAAPGVFGADPSRIEISTFHGFAWRLVRCFGRYAGLGIKPPTLQSESRVKLLGPDLTRLTYKDLLPSAVEILRCNRWRQICVQRWSLIICDEFQDTNNLQWELLHTLGLTARLLLLCDPKQMIYTFLAKEGVGPKRLEDARSLANVVIELEAGSHRDPSNVIPRMAEAIRQRRFNDVSVLEAIRLGRLTVLSNVEDSALATTIQKQVADLRNEGARTIGVFGHSNEGVATLGSALAQAGIDHVLIGIPEAHAEALSALMTMCAYACGMTTNQDLRIALATFLTACTRGKQPPLLALALAQRQRLPPGFEAGLERLEADLRQAASGTMAEMITVASNGWKAIRVTTGFRPWRRACQEFAALARPAYHSTASDRHVRSLMAVLERRRPNALIEAESSVKGIIQLMNFYQTKGREADAVILIYRSGDYLADKSATEPFEEASRVLFVSITRARNNVIVILPHHPHPLIAPFASLVL